MCLHYIMFAIYERFLDNMTNKRRELQEKLAEKALEDAAKKRTEELQQQQQSLAASNSSATGVGGGSQKNGFFSSLVTSPATTPVAPTASASTGSLKEGKNNEHSFSYVSAGKILLLTLIC